VLSTVFPSNSHRASASGLAGSCHGYTCTESLGLAEGIPTWRNDQRGDMGRLSPVAFAMFAPALLSFPVALSPPCSVHCRGRLSALAAEAHYRSQRATFHAAPERPRHKIRKCRLKRNGTLKGGQQSADKGRPRKEMCCTCAAKAGTVSSVNIPLPAWRKPVISHTIRGKQSSSCTQQQGPSTQKATHRCCKLLQASLKILTPCWRQQHRGGRDRARCPSVGIGSRDLENERGEAERGFKCSHCTTHQ